MNRIRPLKPRSPTSEDSNMISIICCIAKNRAIGFENKLLYNIPEDMEHFKKITTGHTVIMGRKTYESIGRPLPKRTNIVISRKEENYQAPNCLNANSLEEAISLAPKQDREIFMIGGGQIYAQSLPLADKLYLTIVDDEPKQADTFFPGYSEFKNIISQKKHNYGGYDLTFVELTR